MSDKNPACAALHGSTRTSSMPQPRTERGVVATLPCTEPDHAAGVKVLGNFDDDVSRWGSTEARGTYSSAIPDYDTVCPPATSGAPHRGDAPTSSGNTPRSKRALAAN